MKISVEMTEEEFLEYCEYRKASEQKTRTEDRSRYLMNKILWSIEPAPGNTEEKPKFKIADHEHAAELYEQASEWIKSHGGK